MNNEWLVCLENFMVWLTVHKRLLCFTKLVPSLLGDDGTCRRCGQVGVLLGNALEWIIGDHLE